MSHLSTRSWLPMNLRSGLEVQMKIGHVTSESSGRYGGASLAAAGEGGGAFWCRLFGRVGREIFSGRRSFAER